VIPPSVVAACAFGHTYIYGHGITWSVHVQWGPWPPLGPLSLSLLLLFWCGGWGRGFVAFKNLPTLLLTYTKHTKLCLIRIWSDRWKWWSSPPHPPLSSWWLWFFLHIPQMTTIDQGFVQWWPKSLCISSYTCSTHHWLLGIDQLWPIVMKLFIYTKKHTHTHTHTHTQLCLRMDWW